MTSAACTSIESSGASTRNKMREPERARIGESERNSSMPDDMQNAGEKGE